MNVILGSINKLDSHERRCVQVEETLTGGEAGPLMTTCELDIEVGDQGVDVVVPLHLQTERRGEGQVLDLNRVDVHFLGDTQHQRTV